MHRPFFMRNVLKKVVRLQPFVYKIDTAGMKNESSEFPPFLCALKDEWLKIVKV